MSMAGFRSKMCEQCGNYFMDDCNDAFCSYSCEKAYDKENETEECIRCGKEFKVDDLYHGLCEWCEEYQNERGDNEDE
jgi:hypothetical protein